jgi:phosphoribosylamine--glycine ligase
MEDVIVYHAGTAEENGRTVTAGGRVLGVTGLGEGIAAARDTAYRAVERISWKDGFCRRDIGYRAIARELAARG